MIVKGTTTRSPCFSLPFTPDPTSTTSPIISWPMMSPGNIAGMKLWNRCRSEPQIAQLVTLTMASRSSSISGSVTVSQRISSLPCQTSARIRCSEVLLESESRDGADGCPTLQTANPQKRGWFRNPAAPRLRVTDVSGEALMGTGWSDELERSHSCEAARRAQQDWILTRRADDLQANRQPVP